MIRHRPHGSGHPYTATPDQRTPTEPDAGDTVTLGVTAAPTVSAIQCTWQATGADGLATTTLLDLKPAADHTAPAAAVDGGHLATAQSRRGRNPAWETLTPPLRGDIDYRYWFLARDEAGRTLRTRPFHVRAGEWTADVPGAGLLLDSHRLVSDSVQWRIVDGRTTRLRFALRLEPDEHVVGFGERFDYLDQRGRVLDATVFEQYKDQWAHGRTYLPMPFAHIISPRCCWGFHVRTSNRSYYDVAASTPNRLVVEVDLDDQAPGTVEVAIYQGSPREVLDQFLAEVGRPEELPDWVFRLWASGNEWNTQRIVMDRMNTHRDLDIPVGTVVIEAWSDEQTFTAFRDARYPIHPDGSPHAAAEFHYPPDGAWPDPKAMIDELHRRGIKVVLWQIPLQKMRPAPTGQAKADARALIRDNHAVRQADGRPYRNRGWWFPGALMPDLSTQHTRDWWTAKRRYLIRDLGVDGFKTDGGEHGWGHDLLYGDGSRGVAGNNRFPVHYAATFGDLLRSQAKPPITLSRAGFTGSQAHGIIWAGDENSSWEAYRASITAGLTASACGILYWTWDLAGFSGSTPDAELYLRATAAATFMPIMQYHSEFNHHRRPLGDRTPWNIAHHTGDPTVIDTFRHYAKIREALIPYLTDSARQTITDGRPLMRALFFDHPDDPTIWNHPHQYLLGDHLLINPVTQPAVTSWTTYLPAGQWTDIWTGRPHQGKQTLETPTPLHHIPAYCQTEFWHHLKNTLGTATQRPLPDREAEPEHRPRAANEPRPADAEGTTMAAIPGDRSGQVDPNSSP